MLVTGGPDNGKLGVDVYGRGYRFRNAIPPCFDRCAVSASGQVGWNLVASEEGGCCTLCRISKISAANCTAINEKDSASCRMVVGEIGIGQLSDFNLQASFLDGLPLGRQGWGFIVIHMAGGKAPRTSKRILQPLNEEQPLSIFNQATCTDDKLAIMNAATLDANRTLAFIDVAGFEFPAARGTESWPSSFSRRHILE